MTLSRRSLLTASGAGAVGIGASACGSGGAVDTSETVDLDADPASLSGEIGLLTPDFIGDDRLVLDEEVIAPFVEETDIPVSVDQVDWNKLNEKISTGIAGASSPT